MIGSARVQGLTPFECLGNFVKWMAVLAAWILCNRLVVVEYKARTQLFLEALPLARWHMLAVFALACWQGVHDLSWRFAAIVGVRALSVAWVVYSYCFLMGMLGRYRVALGLALLMACMILSQQTSLELSHFGPLALLDQTFPFERQQFPWEALMTTWTLALGFSLLALGMSLTREGSVAAMLAESMSYREKVFMATALLGFSWALGTLTRKIHKAPFDLEDAAVEQRSGITVKVSSGLERDPKARHLARYIAAELDAAREYLGMDSLPTVFVSGRRDLDSNRFERGYLDQGEGVYVRANFGTPDWKDEQFLAWLLREVLIVSSDGRLKLETRRWALDGFPLFWASRRHLVEPPSRDTALPASPLWSPGGLQCAGSGPLADLSRTGRGGYRRRRRLVAFARAGPGAG